MHRNAVNDFWFTEVVSDAAPSAFFNLKVIVARPANYVVREDAYSITETHICADFWQKRCFVTKINLITNHKTDFHH